MYVMGLTLGACLLLGAVAVQGVMNGDRHPAPVRKEVNWRLQRSGQPLSRPIGVGVPGGAVGIGGPQLKRVYHMPMKYGPPGYNPHRRQHPQQKVRFGPPATPNGVRGPPPPPPPGWKTKRINAPPTNFGMPPRKVWNPKPLKPVKYQKPKIPYTKRSQLAPLKPDPFSNNVNADFGEKIVTDTYGAPKTVYKVHKVPQTTYGIPHPTQGSPEPPKTSDDAKSELSTSHKVSAGAATSFVHVYQGDANPQDAELETKTSYSFGHSPMEFDKHKGKVYDDVQIGSYELKEAKPKKGFTPPKQTFGFQPYDDKDHFSLTPSHSFFSVSSQQSVGSSAPDSLSHNYFDQKS